MSKLVAEIIAETQQTAGVQRRCGILGDTLNQIAEDIVLRSLAQSHRQDMHRRMRAHTRLRSPMSPSLLEAPARLAVVLLAGLTSSCAGAPSIAVAGAFFPAWLACSLIGTLAAVLARVIFVATGLAQNLPLQLLVCVSAGILCGVMAWVLWIRL